MISITDFLPLVKPKTSIVSSATMTPMHATVSSVCAWVMSSTTATRNTAALERNAALFLMAVAGAGQVTGPPLAFSVRSRSLRKQSVK